MKITCSMAFYEVLLVLAAVCCHQAQSQIKDIPSADNSLSVVGFVGKSVKLMCNVDSPSSQGDNAVVIEWVDLVYNTDHDPKRIFSTENKLGLDKTHINTANFHVDEKDYSLTISGLKLTQDAGQYICRRIVKGTTYERSYYLNVADMPQCQGNTALRPGAETRLTCQAQYSGVLQPVLTWIRDGIEIDSQDDYDILLARRWVSVPPVTDQEDGVEYTCHVKFGSVVEQCRLRLDVAYLATDIVLTPQKKSVIQVGEELRCSARGNPIPEITLTSQLPMGDVRQGKSWKSVVVPKQWAKNVVSVTCSASNSVDGASETLTATAVYNVTEHEQQQDALNRGSAGDRGVIAIVAIVVVVAVVVVAVVIACVMIRRKKKAANRPPKGARPVPTKEEVTMQSNGQAV